MNAFWVILKLPTGSPAGLTVGAQAISKNENPSPTNRNNVFDMWLIAAPEVILVCV
jgi:hypothetical protein